MLTTARSAQSPLDLVLSRLQGMRKTPAGGYLARCPAHDDHRPSLSIAVGKDGRVVGKDGRVLLHCWAAVRPAMCWRPWA